MLKKIGVIIICFTCIVGLLGLGGRLTLDNLRDVMPEEDYGAYLVDDFSAFGLYSEVISAVQTGADRLEILVSAPIQNPAGSFAEKGWTVDLYVYYDAEEEYYSVSFPVSSEVSARKLAYLVEELSGTTFAPEEGEGVAVLNAVKYITFTVVMIFNYVQLFVAIALDTAGILWTLIRVFLLLITGTTF